MWRVEEFLYHRLAPEAPVKLHGAEAWEYGCSLWTALANYPDLAGEGVRWKACAGISFQGRKEFRVDRGVDRGFSLAMCEGSVCGTQSET